MASVEAVKAGRAAVEKYRAARQWQHENLTGKAVHDNKTILAELKAELSEQKFASIDEFFMASDEQNIKELGLENVADFNSKATEDNYIALQGKWK